MKNGKDFIYEYSDLNLFHNRVEVLTGEYAGLIVEFGSSGIAQSQKQIAFNFDYQVYNMPEQLRDKPLQGNKKFEIFLGELLAYVIVARKADKDEHDKLMQAASVEGVTNSKIKIDDMFYPEWIRNAKKNFVSEVISDF